MRLVDPTPTRVAYCDHASREYLVPGGRVIALDDVSIEVVTGRLTVIAGPSGSGKSTLLALLGCLDRPTSGSVRLGEHELSLLGRRERRRLRRSTVATVLPQPSDNLLTALTGTANLRLAARQRLGGKSVDDSGLLDMAASIGIGGVLDRPAGTLSGGEQQRLALACALVGRTPLVLADEPTGALDDASAASVVAAIADATRWGATIVVATHDETVIEAADDVVRLEHGRRIA